MRFEVIKARRSKGLSQWELAKITGLSPDRITNIETGRARKVDVVVADTIAKALDSDLRVLFLDKET
jgi:transcriptional regulator with XRE-family HTH domain